MEKTLRLLLVLVTLLLPHRHVPAQTASAHADTQRIALLIAIQEYATTADRLQAPKVDAERVAKALQKLGFVGVDDSKPTVAVNLTGPQIKAAVNKFRDRLESAGPSAIGFLYYAGHGSTDSEEKENYLWPVDATNVRNAPPANHGVRVTWLTERIESIPPDLRPTVAIVIDACRTPPGAAAIGRGGAQKPALLMPDNQQPLGVLVAHATGPGQVAADDGRFAQVLADRIEKDKDLPIAAMFDEVKRAVSKRSEMKQIPQVSSEVTKAVCLSQCRSEAEARSGAVAGALSILNHARTLRASSDIGQIQAVRTLAASGHKLDGLDLEGIGFQRGPMSYSHFSGASLLLANFDGAALVNSNFSGAGLGFVSAASADFERANLSDSIWYFASAERAKFPGTSASRSNWEGADLRGANFSGANLSGAAFTRANLTGADFSKSDLTNAIFVGAILDGAKFNGATMSNTDFSGAIGSSAQLSVAQQRGICGTSELASDSTYRIRITEDVQDQSRDGSISTRVLVDELVPRVGGLRYLRACERRGEVIAAGHRPVLFMKAYEREVIHGEFWYALRPRSFLGLANRRDLMVKRAQTQIAELRRANESGRYFRVPSDRHVQLRQFLAGKIKDSRVIGPVALDPETVFVYQARFQPGSIPDSQWEGAARQWLVYEEARLRDAARGESTQWVRFFPQGTLVEELDSPEGELFKRWTVARAAEIPLNASVQLSGKVILHAGTLSGAELKPLVGLFWTDPKVVGPRDRDPDLVGISNDERLRMIRLGWGYLRLPQALDAYVVRVDAARLNQLRRGGGDVHLGVQMAVQVSGMDMVGADDRRIPILIADRVSVTVPGLAPQP